MIKWRNSNFMASLLNFINYLGVILPNHKTIINYSLLY